MKLLVLGLDGATFDVMEPLLLQGRLPHLQGLIAQGASGELRSTIPPVTAPAWSSLVTGKNPGKHGIFWFVEDNVQDYEHTYVNASFRDGAAVWRILSEQGKSVGVINVPIE